MLTENDKKLLQAKGITEDAIMQQIKRFETGFPFLKIECAATSANGIKVLSNKEFSACTERWRNYQKSGGSILKFVPASGAASRMFKNIFAFITDGKGEPQTDFEKQFFSDIENFAFYETLNTKCSTLYGMPIRQLIDNGRYVDVAKALLMPDGLNYGAMPKALLKFHKAVAKATRTPLEEHLEEGAQYAVDANRNVNIHFTVSPEHRNAFKSLIEKQSPKLEKVWGVKFNVSMSEQLEKTDTVAVNLDNTLYRDKDGNLLFRPAGHGALIENLNACDAQVVFIKNIDNVVPSKLRAETIRYKKALGGYLLMLQQKIANFLTILEQGTPSAKQLKSMLQFLETELCTHNTETANMDEKQLAEYLTRKFNRPIRVCGMVKNEGEPGGGPYLAYNPDGSCSPQILEAAQIDPDDDRAVDIMRSGTHFNPVDLVCYLHDYKGNPFNLKEFIDPDTGLISNKSTGGVEIKALELPGLWNGSMSDWNTAFVEVPAATFNPVKTVNDLLRKQHQ